MECNQIYLFITRFVTISNHTSFSKFSVVIVLVRIEAVRQEQIIEWLMN